MNSPFKFPRRVRIHGGGCGAVARALHHKAEIISLPAVEENVSSTTNERKSMSTKTTLKRIALAAVAALGIGVLTAVAPASATNVYSSSAQTATLGTTTGHMVSTIITTSGTVTTGTLYWVKTTADSTTALSGYELDDANAAFTATGGSNAADATTGTVTWTRTSGTNQIRLDYQKVLNANPGTFTLCTNDTADGVCETGSALWTVTYNSAVAGTTGTTALIAHNSATAASSSYASPTTATITQTLSNASYIEFEINYEDVTLTDPSKYFVSVTDSTFSSGGVQTEAEWSCNNTNTDLATECNILNAATIVSDYFRVDVPASGTATVKLMRRAYSGGVATDTTLQTFTISGTASTTTYSYATVTTVSQNNGFVVDDKVYAPSAASSLAVAKVSTAQFSTANTALADASAKAVVLTITGRGSLAAANGGAVTAVVADSLDAADDYLIYGDGTAGTGSLAVSVNGVVVKTIALTFYGAPASIVVTPVYSIGRAVAGGAAQGALGDAANGADVSAGPIFSTTTKTATVDTDPAVIVEVKDANGNLTPATISVSSSNPNVVVPLTSADTFVDSGDGIYSGGTFARHYKYTTGAAGVSGQTSTLTFTHTLSTGVTVSGSTTITLGGAPYTETISFDKATYAPGEAMIVTRKAVDSAGNPVYDNAVAAAISFNKAIGGAGVAASVYIGGTAYTTQATRPTAFAPATSGAFEARMTGKKAGATSAIVATATVSDTATDAAVNAAADAAAEAIDAANAATDAANLAAEAADAATVAAEEARDAADAATAAVEALATEVATLMAALKAQITTLANTVAKIAKKVKA